jgi:hypothetical protein
MRRDSPAAYLDREAKVSEVMVGFVMGFACGALWMAHGLLMKPKS